MFQGYQMTLARRQNCAAKHAVEGCDHVTRSVRAWLAAYELSDDACEASKIVPPSMLSKAAIMLRVVAERGFLCTPRSKINSAPGFVVLRAVRVLQSAPCPCLVFDSKLVPNSCMCISFNDGGETNFTVIKTAFFDKIF